MLENNESWDKGGEKSDRLRDRFPHITQTLPQGYTPTWPFWVERYVKNRARVILHLRRISREGNTVNLCAVFERQVASPSSQSVSGMLCAGSDINVEVNSCGNEVEGTVFILNTQLVKQPQGLKLLWQPVRSVVRLQRFNGGLCGCEHVVHLLKPTPPLGGAVPIYCRELGPVHEDGKFRMDVSVRSGETPCQVVERRPKIVEHVPNEHEQPVGRSVSIDDLRADIAPWNILLCDNLVWADCQEIRDFIVQGLQVFVCPDQLHGESGYCCHA